MWDDHGSELIRFVTSEWKENEKEKACLVIALHKHRHGHWHVTWWLLALSLLGLFALLASSVLGFSLPWSSCLGFSFWLLALLQRSGRIHDLIGTNIFCSCSRVRTKLVPSKALGIQSYYKAGENEETERRYKTCHCYGVVMSCYGDHFAYSRTSC